MPSRNTTKEELWLYASVQYGIAGLGRKRQRERFWSKFVALYNSRVAARQLVNAFAALIKRNLYASKRKKE